MIRPEELRIGSIVKDEHEINCSTQYARIISINEMNVEWMAVDHDYCQISNLIDIEPVELTEAILLKCGFSKAGDSFFYPISKRYEVYLYPNENGGYGWGIDSNDISFIIYEAEPIKHLHSLMNFIHALTGTELKVEL